jgi:hypothetical protein
MHNTNVVFRVGVSKDLICWEQINGLSFISLQNIVSWFVSLFALFKLTYLKIMCVKVVWWELSYFRTFNVPLEEAKDLFFGGQNMKGNFQHLPI